MMILLFEMVCDMFVVKLLVMLLIVSIGVMIVILCVSLGLLSKVLMIFW